MRCKDCKWDDHTSQSWYENPMEVAIGNFKVNNCYAELYDENLDACICANYQRKGWKFWV